MRTLLSCLVMLGVVLAGSTGMAQAAAEVRLSKEVVVPPNTLPSLIINANDVPQEFLDQLIEAGMTDYPDGVIHIYVERAEGIQWLTYLQGLYGFWKSIKPRCLICVGPICFFCD